MFKSLFKVSLLTLQYFETFLFELAIVVGKTSLRTVSCFEEKLTGED